MPARPSADQGASSLPGSHDTDASRPDDEGGPAGAGSVALTIVLVTVSVGTMILAEWHVAIVRRGMGWLSLRLPLLLFLATGLAFLGSAVRRFRAPPDDGGPGTGQRPVLARLRFLALPSAMAASVLAYLVPVFGGWVDSTRSPVNLAGIVPYGDGTLWLGGAQRLLFEGFVDDYSAKRPLNPALLAVRLAVTHIDLRMAMVLQGILLGLACGLLARVVARHLGLPAALVVFAGTFSFLGVYAAATLTEPLGVTFGALAAAALWAALQERSPRLFAAGLFLLTIAVSVRPGAIAVLLLLPLWFARSVRGSGRPLAWPALGLGGAAVAAGLAANLMASFSTGGNPARLNSNSMYMVYGLAKGFPGWNTAQPSWAQAFADHPELLSLDDSGREATVRKLALTAVREDPALFAITVLRTEANYLREAKRQAVPIPNAAVRRTVQAAAVVLTALALYRRRLEDRRSMLVDLGLFGACVLSLPVILLWGPMAGLPGWLGGGLALLSFCAFVLVGGARRLIPTHAGFLLVVMAGVLISLPAIGLDSARVLAATAPLMALPSAVAVFVLLRRLPAGRTAETAELGPVPPSHRWSPVAVGAGLVVVALAGAPLAAAAVRKPATASRSCPDGRPSQVLVGATSVRIVADGTAAGRGVAAMDAGPAARRLEEVAVLAGVKSLVRPGTTIAAGLDAAGNDRIAFLDGIGPTDGSSVLHYCGGNLGDNMSVLLSLFWPKPVDFAFVTGTLLPP